MQNKNFLLSGIKKFQAFYLYIKGIENKEEMKKIDLLKMVLHLMMKGIVTNKKKYTELKDVLQSVILNDNYWMSHFHDVQCFIMKHRNNIKLKEQISLIDSLEFKQPEKIEILVKVLLDNEMTEKIHFNNINDIPLRTKYLIERHGIKIEQIRKFYTHVGKEFV